ncbi:MAG: hypothetical protein SFY69_10730 [Planctomycetota bacterium]|nr:hypothetical protein [Planctomycetota bacterium]
MTRRLVPAVILAAAVAAHAQPAPPTPPEAAGQAIPPAEPIERRLSDRLLALAPTDPEAYLLLGEEAAAEAPDADSRELATTLLVLAFETGRAAPGSGWISAAACLALADLTRDEGERRWLVALARTFDPRHAPPPWMQAGPPTAVESDEYQAVLFLGLVRSGEGLRARQLLARPAVRASLDRYDTLLRRLGAGSVSSLSREAERWPCPECGNDRLLKRGRADPRICFHCAGNPGPRLTRAELLAHLRFESWVLEGTQRSWAAQVVTDAGAPLHDPTPDGVARVFEVDPRAVYWRDGRWVRTPDGSEPAEEPADAPSNEPATSTPAPSTSGS